MKLPSSLHLSAGSLIAAAALFVTAMPAAEPESSATSAKDLANRMSAVTQGNALVRAKLEMRAADGTKQVLQLQIKERRTPTSADLLYQVQWPKERKDEAVILHQDSGGAPRGTVLAPPAAPRALDASQMEGGLFGSDLSYQDAIEDFFAWKDQAITGSEIINGVECQILESRPGKSGVSIYAKVRSWIDSKRLVPLRIEKYSANGHVLRRIDTTYVARDQHDRFIPGKLTVRNPSKDSITEFDGARIEQGMQFTDSDFTPGAIPK
ncbi:MAG TPA: outer membrane lipoprotein-sorting protein [Chthoniobacterales bacterium]